MPNEPVSAQMPLQTCFAALANQSTEDSRCLTTPSCGGKSTASSMRGADNLGNSMRHLVPISGKDSLATAIWQTAHEPDLPYEFVFNDTKAELPDTYAWLDKVESTLGIKITRIGKSLEQVIYNKGILPSQRIRFCTELAKIKPMDAFIGKEKATVYFGLRADEPERVGAFKTKFLQPVYPLREAGIGLATVYKIVEMRGLLPPNFFWKRLHEAVMARIDEAQRRMVAGWSQWTRDRLFAWRSRPNCFYCFFQRRYEWVGLLEHYPELFETAERIENEVGNGENVIRESGIKWIGEDFPLSRIRENAPMFFQKRVDSIVKTIREKHVMKFDLFLGEISDGMDEAATSCGLLCGK